MVWAKLMAKVYVLGFRGQCTTKNKTNLTVIYTMFAINILFQCDVLSIFRLAVSFIPLSRAK